MPVLVPHLSSEWVLQTAFEVRSPQTEFPGYAAACPVGDRSVHEVYADPNVDPANDLIDSVDGVPVFRAPSGRQDDLLYQWLEGVDWWAIYGRGDPLDEEAVIAMIRERLSGEVPAVIGGGLELISRAPLEDSPQAGAIGAWQCGSLQLPMREAIYGQDCPEDQALDTPTGSTG